MPHVIAIEGNIGVGKSTLLAKLTEHLRSTGKTVVLITEPVELWKKSGLLKLFYEDKARWAYHFQTVAFSDHILNYRSEMIAAADADYVLLERTPLSNQIFAKLLYEDGDMTDMEWESYQRWCDVWVDLMTVKPDSFVYLTAKPETCLERIRKRARLGEDLIPLLYLQRLHHLHDVTFSSLTKRNVSIVDTEVSEDEVVKRVVESMT